MDIFECYKKFVEHRGCIAYIAEVPDQAYIGDGCMHFESGKPTFVIQIIEDEREEQIKSVIHELLHLSNRYKLLFRGSYFAELHRELEREALRVYETQPDFVKLIREKLEVLDRHSNKIDLENKLFANISNLRSMSDLESRLAARGEDSKPEPVEWILHRVRNLHHYDRPRYFGDEPYESLAIERWKKQIKGRTMQEETYNKILNSSEEELLAFECEEVARLIKEERKEIGH